MDKLGLLKLRTLLKKRWEPKSKPQIWLFIIHISDISRLDMCVISSRKLEIPREHFMQRWALYWDRNGMDLTEAEDIKKRWQEYTEEQYKKDLHDPDNHDGVITDLEPDILECEVKWALESISTNEASGGDGIPVELFQILKDDAMKVLHSICQ